MSQPDPILSLSLNGSFSIHLGRSGFAGTTPTLRLKTNSPSHTATLVISGYNPSTKRFNLPSALQSQVFRLIDIESNTEIAIPPHNEEPGELVVQAGQQPQWFDLAIDGRDEFWKRVLTPGHKYEIRWHDGANAPWAYRGTEHQDKPARLPIHHFSSVIELTVLSADSTQPRVSICLGPTADICHINGEPKFGFRLRMTSRDEDVLTMCFDKTPLKELYGLGDIAHTIDKDGQEVEWPEAIGCWGDDDAFPADHLFEEFQPGVPYERVFWLRKYDESTANGGELEALGKGQTYTVDVSKTLIESAFTMWLRGSKEELLAGSAKEKRVRWGVETGPVVLEVSEPFEFVTV